MNVSSVVDTLLTMGYDAVTVGSDGVYSYLRDRFSVEIKEATQTRSIPLPTLDQAAGDAIRQSQFDGALQGGFLGAGGISTIPMDVMWLVSASVRLTQRIAITYGFGVRSDEEKAAVWTVLGEAAGVEPGDDHQTPSVSQLLLNSVPNVLQTSPYHQVLMFKLVREIILQLLWKEGQQGLRRFFPVAGGVIGAVSNYRFLANVGEVAKKHYHSAHLVQRESEAAAGDADVARMESEANSNPEVQTEQQEESHDLPHAEEQEA
jgi:hypothetical protein